MERRSDTLELMENKQTPTRHLSLYRPSLNPSGHYGAAGPLPVSTTPGDIKSQLIRADISFSLTLLSDFLQMCKLTNELNLWRTPSSVCLHSLCLG